MIELESPGERAVLGGAPLKRLPSDLAVGHIEALARPPARAGAAVVADLVQRVDSPHPRYYIGEGKAGELRDLVEQHDATLVIFDDELSPAQGKNLEELLKVRVL